MYHTYTVVTYPVFTGSEIVKTFSMIKEILLKILAFEFFKK